MNIAWLTPEVVYPPVGGRNGVYNRIVQLSKYNDIYLFSIAYNAEELHSQSEMEKYCKEIHLYNRSENKKLVLLKSLANPFSVASRTRTDLQQDLERTIKEKKIDVVIDDFPNMSLNLMKIDLGDAYCTLNLHNTEYLRMRDMSKVETISRLKRIMYYLESYRLEAYENKIYSSGLFKSVTFFSAEDQAFFISHWKKSKAKTELFPLGANKPSSIQEFKNRKKLLFVGRLDEVAVPNVEAAIWLAQDVFPRVLQKVPEAELIIAGANPCDRVNNLASGNITIVPNYKTLDDIYSKTDYVVLPLLSGGGVKGKLLEAAAYKKVIISTPHGIEGTKFGNDSAYIANDDNSFASACIEALGNPDLSKAQKAYDLFEEYYDWDSIGKKYNEFLQKVVKESRKV